MMPSRTSIMPTETSTRCVKTYATANPIAIAVMRNVIDLTIERLFVSLIVTLLHSPRFRYSPSYHNFSTVFKLTCFFVFRILVKMPAAQFHNKIPYSIIQNSKVT